MKDDPKTVLSKMQRFCAYKERCISEVRNKMKLLRLSDREKENIVESLQAENFIDEERYSKSFARSKFLYNNWGKIKIKYVLAQKGLPRSSIENALKTIDEDEYIECIEKLIRKKTSELKKKEKTDVPFRVMNYMTVKGFERHIVYQIQKTKALK